MLIKTFASALVAALLLTGTPVPVSQNNGQGVQRQEPQTVAAETNLTKAEAIDIALKHAKLTKEEVTDLRAHQDWDDRVLTWNVYWRFGDWEYEYDIHAESGAVLEWERDQEPLKKAKKPTQPPKTEKEYLSREEALAIALRHAGVSQSKIKGLDMDLDRDDRRPEWDIEFVSGGYEYSYEIHGETGAILDWDKERDD